jgi:hypothetical protein
MERRLENVGGRMRVALVDPSTGRPAAEWHHLWIGVPEEVHTVCAIRAADLDGDGIDELFVEKATPAGDWRVLGVFRQRDAKLFSLMWQGMRGRVWTAHGGTECEASYQVTPASADGTSELVLTGGEMPPDCVPHRYRLVAGALLDENGAPAR